MRIAWRDMRALSAGLATAASMAAASAGAQQARPPTPDIHFVPTPMAIVDEMLKLAQVTATDVIYDLGVMLVLVAGLSIPNFALATFFVWLFSLKLGALPVAGWDKWQHVVLPRGPCEPHFVM